MVQEKTFREDLYFRLKVVRVRLPPLRDRLEDLDELVRLFLAGREAKGRKLALTDEAMERLRAHSWPGNVRELQNVLVGAMSLHAGEAPIEAEELDLDQAPAPPVTARQVVERAHRDVIEEALKKTGGNRKEAAKALEMDRGTLWKRMKKLGIKSRKG
jgi:transcriptional regulator with PAS, ATPase and Fis domain